MSDVQPTPWMNYVKTTIGAQSQLAAGKRAGLSQPTIGRWLRGDNTPLPAEAAKFAAAYNRDVLAAFVAAGWLTEDEANMQPARPVDLAVVPGEALADEVKDRLTREPAVQGLGRRPRSRQRKQS